jgi:AraC-like DNA-binding protein
MIVAEAANAQPALRSRHEAIIDLLIAAPHLKIREIAEKVGLSQSYISTLINSDTFKSRLAIRREELVDPLITASFESRMQGALAQSLEVLQDELEKKQSADLALRILEIGGRGSAYGARPTPGGNGQPSVVINLPGAAQNAQAWLDNAGGNK